MELPKGWASCRLDDANLIIAGQSPESKYYNKNGDGLPFFQGKADFGQLYPTNRIYCTVPKKIAKNGDILLSVRAPVGPTNLARETIAIGRGLNAIRPLGGISARFVLYYFKQIEPVFSGEGTGTTFSAVTVDDVKSLHFPLPPLAEQHRIVAKIDALFSKLDKGVEMLQTIRQQLRTYRQAVLKLAFEGKLTRCGSESKWIKSNLGSVICVLTDYHANGSYKVLKENVTLLDREDYAIMIRSTDFEKGDLSNGLKYIDKHAYEFLKKSQLFGGEILMGKIGNAGRVYYMPFLSRPVSLAMNMFAIRVKESILTNKYLYYYLLSPKASQEIKGYVQGDTPTINKTSVRKIGIEYPESIDRQVEIVATIESRLSVCDKLEALVEENFIKAEALRQSILKKAFAGLLVPQDPSDEPTEKLLERIRAEKQAATAKLKPARRKKNG